MKIERKGIELKLRNSTEAGTFEGLGSVFGNEDHGGDIVMPGAFKESLKLRKPKMLLQHGFDMATGMIPVGRWDDLKETDEGLALKGSLFLDTDPIRLAYRAMKEGELDGLSIGYRPLEYEWDRDRDGVRLLKKVDLLEVSIVTFPMNELATVDAVKSLVDAGRLSKREFERTLRDVGFTQSQAKAIAADGYKGLAQRDVVAQDQKLKEQLSSLEETLSCLTQSIRSLRA